MLHAYREGETVWKMLVQKGAWTGNAGGDVQVTVIFLCRVLLIMMLLCYRYF